MSMSLITNIFNHTDEIIAETILYITFTYGLLHVDRLGEALCELDEVSKSCQEWLM